MTKIEVKKSELIEELEELEGCVKDFQTLGIRGGFLFSYEGDILNISVTDGLNEVFTVFVAANGPKTESTLDFMVSMRILRVLKMLKHESGYRKDRIILAVDEERNSMEIRSVSGYYMLSLGLPEQKAQMDITLMNYPDDEDYDCSMYECKSCGSL